MSSASRHSGAGPNPLKDFAQSPSPQGSSSNASFQCRCVVEDFHGRPASQPLSLSLTPERVLEQERFPVQDSVAFSFVSPVYDKELHLSGTSFPSPLQAAHGGAGMMPPPVFGACGGGRASQDHRPSGGLASRNGNTTMASSMNGLHVTQSGIVIPPIQGIPRPEGLPPDTPVEYAKVKGKGKRGPKRSRLAVQGAFSNMTSVAVLQQVQPLQKKSRQVEPADWGTLDAALVRSEYSDIQLRKGDAAARSFTSGGKGESGESYPTSFPTAAAAAAARRPSPPMQVQTSLQLTNPETHHSRSNSTLSNTSLTPSEAAMVAAAWEEDVAAGRVGTGGGHYSNAGTAAAAASGGTASAALIDDDWDRAEEEAMRIQAYMLRHQHEEEERARAAEEEAAAWEAFYYYQQNPHLDTPNPPPALESQRRLSDVHRHQQQQPSSSPHQQEEYEPSPMAVRQCDTRDDVAPYAVRTAASAHRTSPPGWHVQGAESQPPQQQWPSQISPNGEVHCAELSDSPVLRGTSSSAAASASGHKQHHSATSSPTPSKYPRGFEAYAERGQQRRAEAERAQLERAAEAAGEPLPPPSHQQAHQSQHPPPQHSQPACDYDGEDVAELDATAPGAQSASSFVAGTDAASGAAAAAASRSAKRPRKMSVLAAPRGFEVYMQKGQSRRAEAEREEAQRHMDEEVNCTHKPQINRRSPVSGGAAADAAQLAAGHADNAVFERLAKEAEKRDQRLRQLEDKYTPSFVPHRITASPPPPPAAAAATEHGDGHPSDDTTDPADPSQSQQSGAPRTNSAGSASKSKQRGTGRNVFESLYSLAKKTTPQPTAAAPHSTGSPSPPQQRLHATSEKADSAPSEGVPTTNDAPVDSAAAEPAHADKPAAKKSQSEIKQHLSGMTNREEERRARWEQQLAADAAEQQERRNHLALNPKTDELAERARARYRMKEELAKQQRDAEAAQRQEQQKKEETEVAAAKKRAAVKKGGSSRAPAAASSTASAESRNALERPGNPPAKTAAASQAANHSATTPARRSLGAEFYAQQQKTEERRHRHLEQLRLQRAEEEFRECTFRPHLNSTSERIAQRTTVESYGDAYYEDSPRTGEHSMSATPQDGELRCNSIPGSSAELSYRIRRSPIVSARSRSLLQELQQHGPSVMPDSKGAAPRAEQRSITPDSEGGDHFKVNVQPLELQTLDRARVVDMTPQRPSEPLSAQLRNLEEMLREWKELERECSPMLRQPRQPGLVE